jgi:hypothetical protein
MAHGILLCNFVAHYWNMSTTRKKGHNANAVAAENLGRPTGKYAIEDAVKLVSFHFYWRSSSSHCELKILLGKISVELKILLGKISVSSTC